MRKSSISFNYVYDFEQEVAAQPNRLRLFERIKVREYTMTISNASSFDKLMPVSVSALSESPDREIVYEGDTFISSKVNHITTQWLWVDFFKETIKRILLQELLREHIRLHIVEEKLLVFGGWKNHLARTFWLEVVEVPRLTEGWLNQKIVEVLRDNQDAKSLDVQLKAIAQWFKSYHKNSFLSYKNILADYIKATAKRTKGLSYKMVQQEDGKPYKLQFSIDIKHIYFNGRKELHILNQTNQRFVHQSEVYAEFDEFLNLYLLK